MFLITILLFKHNKNYKFTEIFYFHNIGHISWSWDGPVQSPRVIKARDRLQDRVIDILVQDQNQDQAKSWSQD